MAAWHAVVLDLWPVVGAGAVSAALEDLETLVLRDPAARFDAAYAARTYRSFHAVAGFRLTSALWTQGSGPAASEIRVAARSISEDLKVATGVEIHPAARIGRRLVIDHGYGTVIGETSEIGDDCYLLQGVVLGATGVADNPPGKRHPTLGHRVEVGAFARVLGPVTVGDDVQVGSMATVLDDVPSDRSVTVNPGVEIVRISQRGVSDRS